jgi:holo-[acyl-carrier protein] synthase
MTVGGRGARGVAWRDIETLFHPSGKPYVRLGGGAAAAAARLGIREMDVSLSHCRDYATATAIGSE